MTSARLRWSRMAGRFDQKTIVLGLVTIVVTYLSVVPVALLVWGSLKDSPPGMPGSLTLENYIQAYSQSTTFLLMFDTVIYAGGTMALALCLGTVLAWLVERTNMPGKSLAYALVLTHLFVPGVLFAICWQLLLSPRIGLINQAIMGLLRLKTAPFSIYTMPGMIWLEGLGLTPLVFVLMGASFRAMDPSLEEAAVVSGAGVLTTLRRVTLKLMMPALLAVALMVFVRGLESFEIPAMVGVPGKILVFTSQIYIAIREYPPNSGLATTLSMTLLVLSAIGLYAYNRVTRRAERFATITGKGYRPKLIDLGRGRVLALGFFLGYFALVVLLPFLVLLWGSLLPYYSAPSLEGLAKISLNNYISIWKYPGVINSIKNTAVAATLAATLTMLLAALVSWIVVKTRIRGRHALDMLAFLPYAFPGTVLGVAMLWFYVSLPIGLYGTLWAIILAYITRFLPLGLRTSSPAMMQISKDLEDAAEANGASFLQTFRRVTLPLLWPAFIGGWIYVAVLATKELSSSIMLYSPDSIVLPIMIFDMWDNGNTEKVAALGVMMVVALGIMVTAMQKLGGRGAARR